MGTLNAIYVRANDPAKLALLHAVHRSAYTEPMMEFYAVDRPTNCFKAPESELISLSSRLETDVLWLGFQSVVDAFQFHHWRAGIHRRSLVYGCFGEERTWERIEGESEPWETEAFFAPSSLNQVLKYSEGQEEKELTRIWRESEIKPGRREPSVDSRETARKVAQFYKLPGWASNSES